MAAGHSWSQNCLVLKIFLNLIVFTHGVRDKAVRDKTGPGLICSRSTNELFNEAY